jgi:hypothetical protein
VWVLVSVGGWEAQEHRNTSLTAQGGLRGCSTGLFRASPKLLAPPLTMAMTTDVVPDMVKTFVAYFYRHIREKNGQPRSPPPRRRREIGSKISVWAGQDLDGYGDETVTPKHTADVLAVSRGALVGSRRGWCFQPVQQTLKEDSMSMRVPCNHTRVPGPVQACQRLACIRSWTRVPDDHRY